MKVDHYLTSEPISRAASEAKRAADLGFDGLMAAETRHDPFLALAAAATEPRLELGTAIAVAFARSPTVLAHTAWDLADVTGGRFVLGLGTQVRAHVAGRFGMPWSDPVGRMEDYVAAMREVWRAWRAGDRPRHRGPHYRITLAIPFFTPPEIEYPDPPIWLAAVGPVMFRLVGRTADGVHVHPFHTRRYLEEVAFPEIARGAEGKDRDPGDIQRASVLFVVTGESESEMAAAAQAVRKRIAFYASTPSYRGVLEAHGWEFGPVLSDMSRRGAWDEMGALIDEEVLNQVAVVAPLDSLADAITARCRGVLDRVGLDFGGQPPHDALMADLLVALRSAA